MLPHIFLLLLLRLGLGGQDLVGLDLGLAALEVRVVQALLVRVPLVAAAVGTPPRRPPALVEGNEEVAARVAEGQGDLRVGEGLEVLIPAGFGLRIGMVVSSHDW